MLNERHFFTSAKILGFDDARRLLFTSMEEVEEVLEGVVEGAGQSDVLADRLHGLCNTFTALGANQLSITLAELETQLRSNRPGQRFKIIAALLELPKIRTAFHTRIDVLRQQAELQAS